MDIYPCTVDEKSWDSDMSMKTLFGHLCSENIFAHDLEMTKLLELRATRHERKRRLESSQDMQTSEAGEHENGSLSDSSQRSMRNLGQLKVLVTPGPATKRVRKIDGAQEQRTPEQYSLAVHTAITTSTTTSDGTRVRAIKTSFDARVSRNSAISPSDQQSGLMQAFEPSLRTGITRNSPLREKKADVSIPGRLNTVGAHEYQCQWLACNRTFHDLSQLRQHVLTKHMVGTRRNGVSRFDCMRPGCRSLEDGVISNKEAWKEHLDSQHYSPEISGPLLDGPAQSRTEPERSSRSSAHQVTHIEQRGHVSPQPGAAQNQPIELSDGSDSDEDRTTEFEPVHGEGDSQLSLSDSAFASQEAANLPRQLLQGRISNRKEAFKAATGEGDRNWATYSPFASSNTEAERDLELR